MIAVRVVKPLTIKYSGAKPANLARLGAFALDTMLARIARHRNADDREAKPYSDRGPIYVANTGRGRTKQGLGGREVLTPADRRAMAKRGAPAGKTRGGKTSKFADYSAYKRALGKSGQRDLELSGRMLGSLGIVRQTATSVVIGFRREAEHLKGLGNQRQDPWFGLSPKDEAVIVARSRQILDLRLAAD